LKIPPKLFNLLPLSVLLTTNFLPSFHHLLSPTHFKLSSSKHETLKFHSSTAKALFHPTSLVEALPPVNNCLFMFFYPSRMIFNFFLFQNIMLLCSLANTKYPPSSIISLLHSTSRKNCPVYAVLFIFLLFFASFVIKLMDGLLLSLSTPPHPFYVFVCFPLSAWQDEKAFA
jgi:hypothetical protein